MRPYPVVVHKQDHKKSQTTQHLRTPSKPNEIKVCFFLGNTTFFIIYIFNWTIYMFYSYKNQSQIIKKQNILYVSTFSFILPYAIPPQYNKIVLFTSRMLMMSYKRTRKI